MQGWTGRLPGRRVKVHTLPWTDTPYDIQIQPHNLIQHYCGAHCHWTIIRAALNIHFLDTIARYASGPFELLHRRYLYPTGIHFLDTILLLPSDHFLPHNSKYICTTDNRVLGTISVPPSDHFVRH